MYLFSSRTFTHNMVAFGLSKKLCNDFLKKQAVIGNLNEGNSLFIYMLNAALLNTKYLLFKNTF